MEVLWHIAAVVVNSPERKVHANRIPMDDMVIQEVVVI